ncbi:putative uncharacterized protein [Bifidobacterium bifidum CAG:234]|nr:putative uncharacterized protein [Bifidobacterium bifidum CAG:234]
MEPIVRTLSVMSSPVTPSPRVSPCSSTPLRYIRFNARPSIFTSQVIGNGLPSGQSKSRSTESYQSRSSSIENTSSRLIMRDGCRTEAKSLENVPPTRCVGDCGESNDGNSASSRCRQRKRAS